MCCDCGLELQAWDFCDGSHIARLLRRDYVDCSSQMSCSVARQTVNCHSSDKNSCSIFLSLMKYSTLKNAGASIHPQWCNCNTIAFSPLVFSSFFSIHSLHLPLRSSLSPYFLPQPLTYTSTVMHVLYRSKKLSYRHHIYPTRYF